MRVMLTVFALTASMALLAAGKPLPVPLGDGWHSYITPDGKRLTAQRFDSAYAFADGMAQVETGVKRSDGVFDHSDARWGFIDSGGTLVIAAQWESCGAFADGLAPVRKDGRWGYVDKTGAVQIEPQFLRAESFADGRAAVEVGGGLWNYIDATGKPVFVPLGADMSDPRKFYSQRLVLDMGDSAKVVDVDGNTVFEIEGFMRDFGEDGVAAFRQGDAWGFIDRAGNVVTEPRLGFAWGLTEGLALAQVDGKSGYVNAQGEWVIPAQFADANRFTEGLAFVRKDALYGYIDKTGNWAIVARFKDPMDSASAFSEGRARVDLDDGRAAWIDAGGQVIWSQEAVQ